MVGNTLGTHLETDLSFLKSGVCYLGRVLVLLDFRNDLHADLVIKRGSVEFSQPLDYLGVPFKCNRCHVFGHLMDECSLPFNKKPYSGSAHKIWRVKNGGQNSRVKMGFDKSDGLKDLNLSPKAFIDEAVLGSQPVSLMSLKPLCIASLSEFEGPVRDKIDEGFVVGSLNNFVQSDALRDLGFVSPLKGFPIVRKGYFLHSCSKVNKDGGFGLDRDPSRIHMLVQGRVGCLATANSEVKAVPGVLRALYAPT